jgi:hypothetical protein
VFSGGRLLLRGSLGWGPQEGALLFVTLSPVRGSHCGDPIAHPLILSLAVGPSEEPLEGVTWRVCPVVSTEWWSRGVPCRGLLVVPCQVPLVWVCLKVHRRGSSGSERLGPLGVGCPLIEIH